jgi:HD-GYP domain-containing protein (c-di-GMP phosphodiesterase class II)
MAHALIGRESRGRMLNGMEWIAADWGTTNLRVWAVGVDGGILAEASWPAQILSAVRHHHERWDGNGYPFGLAGASIPWDARILSVADAMDALTSDRPNRTAITPDEALRRLRPESGIQFDPTVASANRRASSAQAPRNSDLGVRSSE